MVTLEVKQEIARQRQAQLLEWIANPFTKHDHEHLEEHSAPIAYEPAPTAKPPPHSDHHHHHHHIGDHGDGDGETTELMTTGEKLAEVEEIEEATPIELFYDLFFVANLTTVTSVHYITEWRTLSSYILFFIILWFTWLHVTLLDVRFSVDSVYERACKSIHFAVMAVFSSVSTTWDPFSPDFNTAKSLRTMTLTLMFSRFIIGIQYFVVMGFGWSISRRKVVVPLAIHGAVMLISSAVYLGLYFTFDPEEKGKYERSYIGWYAMVFFEVVAVIGTSCTWRIVSFKKTHLVERMGLLTLIIFGEGIIVMLKGINTVVKGFGWSKTMVGVIASALFIVYFYWMFYFDYNPRNVHYGSIRQQVWCLLHFPFHLAVVLSVEGLRQLLTFYNLSQTILQIGDDLQVAYRDPVEEGKILMKFFKFFYDDGNAKSVVKDYSKITATIKLFATYSPDEDIYSDTWNDLVYRLFTGLTEFYGVKAPYPKKDAAPVTEAGKFMNILDVFNLAYQYFFISVGVVFAMYGVFAIIVRRHMDIFDYISISLRFIIAAIFIAMLALPTNDEAYNKYIVSPWLIPQVCMMIFVVLVVDKTMSYFALRRANYRLEAH